MDSPLDHSHYCMTHSRTDKGWACGDRIHKPEARCIWIQPVATGSSLKLHTPAVVRQLRPGSTIRYRICGPSWRYDKVWRTALGPTEHERARPNHGRPIRSTRVRHRSSLTERPTLLFRHLPDLIRCTRLFLTTGRVVQRLVLGRIGCCCRICAQQGTGSSTDQRCQANCERLTIRIVPVVENRTVRVDLVADQRRRNRTRCPANGTISSIRRVPRWRRPATLDAG